MTINDACRANDLILSFFHSLILNYMNNPDVANYTFNTLHLLMQKAEDQLNHGLTITLFDNFSGDVTNYDEEGPELIFEFKNLQELFDSLLKIATPKN